MDEVEAVARAVAPMMEGGREFDQMPPTRLELRQWSRSGMCSTNDATQDDATELAQAAIAALDAARGKAEPVAWRYVRKPEEWPPANPVVQSTRWLPDDPARPFWIEQPLYAHPTRGDQVARVVEWLRKENGLCDCHARCETECGCGAWDDWKTKPLLEIADAIDRGEPFNG